MTFGEAIEMLKRDKRVRRAGWNGKGMWLVLTPGHELASVGADSYAGEMRDRIMSTTSATRAALYRSLEFGDAATDRRVTVGAHIDMRAADGTLVIGWLASQTDMLAEDWEVLS